MEEYQTSIVWVLLILSVQSESPPLRLDDSGAYRVGDSRVLLEVVIEAFEAGATPPETIVQQYPTSQLSDIYAVN
jgi:hypothetical protein